MPDPIDAITEAEFQAAVIQLARSLGWSYWHIGDARRVAGGRLVGDREAAGLPDLILVHPLHGFLYAELKRQKGRVRPAQTRALDKLGQAALATAMTACKTRVHLWRPSDMEEVIVPAFKGKGPITYGW